MYCTVNRYYCDTAVLIQNNKNHEKMRWRFGCKLHVSCDKTNQLQRMNLAWKNARL